LHRKNFEDLRDEGPLRGKGVIQSSTLPVQDQDDIPEAVTSISRGVEGALFQFELDVAGDTAVTAAVAPVDGIVPTAKSPVGTADAIAKGQAVESQGVATARRTSTVDPFRAMNVPCPRLCGATFGMGGEGIIVFSNGDVRRQWTRFQAEQQSNRAESKQQLPSKSPNKDGRSRADNNKSQQCPRTMLDLMRMNAAAKIAQIAVRATMNHPSDPRIPIARRLLPPVSDQKSLNLSFCSRQLPGETLGLLMTLDTP
jgi:hypothetical protein